MLLIDKQWVLFYQGIWKWGIFIYLMQIFFLLSGSFKDLEGSVYFPQTFTVSQPRIHMEKS